jgi:hypothetical protein
VEGTRITAVGYCILNGFADCSYGATNRGEARNTMGIKVFFYP